MLKLKDIKEKLIQLETNQYNSTEEVAETIEELRWHLLNAGRLLRELGEYDDLDEEVSDKEWETIINWF